MFNFQPSLIFATKAGAYLSWELNSKGRTLALDSNIGLGWTWLTFTSTLGAATLSVMTFSIRIRKWDTQHSLLMQSVQYAEHC